MLGQPGAEIDPSSRRSWCLPFDPIKTVLAAISDG
jgi:hypothetical protein